MRLPASAAALYLSAGLALACGPQEGTVTLPVTPSERALIYTATDLSQDFEGFSIDPSKETWKLERDHEGTYNLVYTYEDLATQPALYMMTTLVRAQSTEVATEWRTGLREGFDGGGPKVGRRDHNELLHWGSSQCQMLMNDTVDIGTVCFFQKEHLAGMVVMAGAMWTEPDEVTQFLQSRLDRFEAWEPRAPLND